MSATSHRPAAIAAMACSTWAMNEHPPICVPSTYRGWMPRYSAVSDAIQVPALNTASTASLSSPASASALRAASACSANADLWGSFPISSDSATPTIATRPRIGFTPRPRNSRPARPSGSRPCSHRLEARQRDLRRHVLEHHLDRHADRDPGRIGLDADQVRHEPGALHELDDGDHVRRPEREVLQPAVHHGEGMERAAAGEALPFELGAQTARADRPREEDEDN